MKSSLDVQHASHATTYGAFQGSPRHKKHAYPTEAHFALPGSHSLNVTRLQLADLTAAEAASKAANEMNI